MYVYMNTYATASRGKYTHLQIWTENVSVLLAIVLNWLCKTSFVAAPVENFTIMGVRK